MKRIGLVGFEFDSPNKGCEALSYSFIQLIEDNLNDEKIEILLLSGASLGVLPKRYPNIMFNNVPYGMRDIKLRFIRAIRSCDVIFDITMGDSFSDIYSKDYCLSLIRIKKRMELFGKKYVLLPQTYGPFNSDKVKKQAIAVINKADIVISRDQTSIDYLREIGVKRKLSKEIDLAFLLPYDQSKFSFDSRKVRVGLNVSGLLWSGGFLSDNQFGLKLNYQQYIEGIMKFFSKSNEYELHLIPHVIDLKEKPHDDDYNVLKKLHSVFPNTILAPAFDNPIDAKSYIANMDCFIGSRMHSTVAALSSGVAVIPVSYSRKFEGLFGSLDYDYLIHAKKEDTDESINKTILWVENHIELKNKVEIVKKDIGEKCNHLKNTLIRLLREVKNGYIE